MSSQNNTKSDSDNQSNKHTATFDENSSYFFIVGMLSLVIIPWTLFYIRKLFKSIGKPAERVPFQCKCNDCLAHNKIKTSHSSTLWFIFYIVLVVLLAIFVKKAFSVPKETRWDPYEILGISSSANEAQIKKAFRTKSLKYHPDKNPSKEAAEIYIELTKAYEALTNPDTKENWEKYGNPDGQQASDIKTALPSFFGDKSKAKYVVFGYFVILVTVPVGAFLVLKSWTQKSSNSVLMDTMRLFYVFLKDKIKTNSLLEILCASDEIQHCCKYRSSDDRIVHETMTLTPFDKRIDNNKRDKNLNAPFIVKSSIYLNAHMSQVNDKLPPQVLQELNNNLLPLVPTLINGLLTISTGFQYLIATLSSIHLLQNLIQGCEEDTQLLQLPFIDRDVCDMLSKKKFFNITNLKKFLSLKPEELQKVFELGEFSPVEKECVLNVISKMPTNISVSYEYIVDDNKDLPLSQGSIISCNITVTRNSKPSNDFFSRELHSDDKTEIIKNAPIEVHCPFFPARREEHYYVILGDPQKNILIGIKKITPFFDTPITTKIEFEAPPKGNYNEWRIYVIPDCYSGLDIVIPSPIHITSEKSEDEIVNAQVESLLEDADDDDDDYDDLTSESEDKEYEYSDEEPSSEEYFLSDDDE